MLAGLSSPAKDYRDGGHWSSSKDEVSSRVQLVCWDTSVLLDLREKAPLLWSWTLFATAPGGPHLPRFCISVSSGEESGEAQVDEF